MKVFAEIISAMLIGSILIVFICFEEIFRDNYGVNAFEKYCKNLMDKDGVYMEEEIKKTYWNKSKINGYEYYSYKRSSSSFVFPGSSYCNVYKENERYRVIFFND